MSSIYFIRHGQARFGTQNYDRLSDLGARQSQILGDYFQGLGLEFDAVYSGSSERQLDTARWVLSRILGHEEKVGLNVTSSLNECDATSIIKSQVKQLVAEDPSLSEQVTKIREDPISLQIVYERAMLRWISEGFDAPGLETWEEFKGRVCDRINTLREVHGRNKRIAVFTSGGPVSIVMQMALGLTDSQTLRLSWQIRNSSVSVFRYNERVFTLLSFNSVAHLEQTNDGQLITFR
jgi:broad specificity phosphatase PhoE